MSIKTKIIETGKATILVIGGLLEDANITSYLDAKISAIWMSNDPGLEFPLGNWQILGKLDEIT